jgi:hypothetical protein
MLSLQEGIDVMDLSDDEIEAIAEHEHVPEIVAAEIGNTLLKTRTGICLLKLYLQENIERARQLGRFDKARRLDALCRRFDGGHSEIEPVAAQPRH